MPVSDANKLTLQEVQRLLHLEEQLDGAKLPALAIDPLTEAEEHDLAKIRSDFRRYLVEEKVSEGLAKFLTLAPLLRLTGFYDEPIRLTLKSSIEIAVEDGGGDENKLISGWLDLLALRSTQHTTAHPLFWILVIEAKNSAIEVYQGLPQLLTYAYKSLEHQPSVWGVVTNGLRYLFVYLQRGNPSTYHLLPDLNLLEADRSIQLVQTLKALCRLQFKVDTPIAS